MEKRSCNGVTVVSWAWVLGLAFAACTTTGDAPVRCVNDGNCPSGETCINRTCVPESALDGGNCAATQRLCSGSCVDTESDPRHCGSCGNACSSGWTCASGRCTAPCDNGLMRCGSACIDSQTSTSHCGFCGNACTAGDQCVGGACYPVCLGDQESPFCTGICLDLSSSQAHCGSCGNACEDDTSLCCEGGCVDPTRNVDHCTGCGTACASGESCCNGCVDLQSDPNHCGACDNACGSGKICSSGDCKTACPSIGVRGTVGSCHSVGGATHCPPFLAVQGNGGSLTFGSSSIQLTGFGASGGAWISCRSCNENVGRLTANGSQINVYSRGNRIGMISLSGARAQGDVSSCENTHDGPECVGFGRVIANGNTLAFTDSNGYGRGSLTFTTTCN